MKVEIDIDKDYFDVLKYEFEVCHNDYKPIKIIANGKPLDQDTPKGYTHQRVDRQLMKEIMTDANKCKAYAQLQKAVQNFTVIIGDIDMHIDIQTKARWKQCDK